ncbi:MAG: penicillin acylase family protein [Pyrinomonadaceae bacterium]|nr:penicillin acylase family protein [Pyrinomonadaceae bacterium]
MKNKLKHIWLSALFLLVASACWAQTPTRTLNVAGLADSVTVRRDERGIPYIEAKTEADLYFAQGYVTASDRLWQMDLLRRVARGETAEIFGKVTLEEDKRWRKFNFAGVAVENVKNLQPATRSILENYTRGVNAYLATLDDQTLPVEFRILQYKPREWKMEDSLVVSKIFDDGLSNTWRMDLMKASLMDLPKEKLARVLDPQSPLDVLLVGKDSEKSKSQTANLGVETQDSELSPQFEIALAKAEEVRKSSLSRIGFYAEDLAASNNWVISGKRTIDGKPLLANDPHLPPTQPPIWYLVNLSAPNLKVAGVSTAGLPGVIIGHNENIAWGMTNVGPDVQDMYLETFDAGGKVKTPKGYESPTIRREEIKVRKNALAPDTTTEILEVVNTRHGVVFFEDAGKKYSLKWTAFDAKNDSLTMVSLLAKAKNWTDFRGALKSWGGAMQNFVYADTQGNIGWTAAGRVPIRKTGDGSLPYDGAADAGDWTGFVPFEELPSLYNPPENFIMTANQRTVGQSYKYQNVIARAHTVARAKRLQDLLNSKPKVSIDDVRDFQFDTFSVINSRFAKEVVNQKGASDETLKLLTDWDGRMNHESKAALVADAMRSAFRTKILAGTFGAERAKTVFLPYDGAFFDRLIAEKPSEWLPKDFASYADLLKTCETEAKEFIVKQIGADETKWTWGSRAKVNFPHPLAVAPLIGLQFQIAPRPQNGSGGAGATPNVGASVSMRFIATPGDWDATRHVIPTGESGDPQSPHWKDQLESWYSGNTPVFPFTKAAIEKAARETVLLIPRK